MSGLDWSDEQSGSPSVEATDDFATRSQAVLSRDMARKSVFDVACKLGRFCFEAERRGAQRIVGGDVGEDLIEKCRSLAAARGSRAEFVVFDVERDPIPGRFDCILCLDVLQRLRNPLAVLEKLIEAAREDIVLEITSFVPRNRLSDYLSSIAATILNRLPIFRLGGAGNKDWDGVHRFFITRRAVRTLLTRHRNSIAKVDFVSSGQTGRSIAIARKRRIGHLVIVAGVPASGKTTVINRLKAGELPDLARRLDFDCAQHWLSSGYGDIFRLTEPTVANMILHFNITTPLVDGDHYGYHGGLLDLINVADTTSVVTLWCPPDELGQRYRSTRIRSGHFGPKRLRRNRKTALLLSLYDDPDRLAVVFGQWFSFVRRYCRDGLVFENTGIGKIATIDGWERDNPGTRTETRSNAQNFSQAAK